MLMTLSSVLMVSCNKNNDDTNTTSQNSQTGDGAMPVATIELEDGMTIKIELYPDIAPNTVNNFISLANSGFYDGTIFHRTLNTTQYSIIQGGDPLGNGTGGPGYTLKGEFSKNGFDNQLKHTRGVISMARRGMDSTGNPNYDSAGCQFFIVASDSVESWDGSYATFGKVIEGMDVVDEIAASKTDANDKPVNDVVMKTVRVETFGTTYPEPETIK